MTDEPMNGHKIEPPPKPEPAPAPQKVWTEESYRKAIDEATRRLMTHVGTDVLAEFRSAPMPLPMSAISIIAGVLVQFMLPMDKEGAIQALDMIADGYNQWRPQWLEMQKAKFDALEKQKNDIAEAVRKMTSGG